MFVATQLVKHKRFFYKKYSSIRGDSGHFYKNEEFRAFTA